MTRPVSRPSLRTELLVNFAILAVAALFFAVATVVLLYDRVEPARGVVYISVLVAADVMVVVAFGGFQIHRLIVRPLRETAAAAEAIASGDLRRRIASQDSLELNQLAESVNRMTERLLEEQAQLVRAEKLASVGRLAAGIAHEIGNPLGALNGYSHILRGHVAANPLALDAVTGFDRETARIDRIVRGLLDYARPRRPTPTPIDINESVRHVVDLLSAQGVLRRVSLRLELANEAPRVHGERHDLEQLFVNLLLNAAHAVEGTGTVTVRTNCISRSALQEGMVRSGDSPGENAPHPPSPRVRRWLESESRPDDVVKVVVADSGPGVPVEDRERIFDPFFTTREPGKGTGLGLAIVLRIVENFQGIVWVQSAREGGAAFHLLLPLAPPADAVHESRMTTTAPFPALS
ncbi:MAG: ATP-binding region ATPase domain protein [Gemmatimonadetes bacterium]|nr:ATP-binding region ATPase domain protein [Gemmatimonadota bacterium]